MTMLLIQSAILLAIAFIIGCLIGYWLRRWFGAGAATAPVVATTVVASSVAVTAVAARAREEAIEFSTEPAPVAHQPTPAAPIIAAAAKPAAKATKPDDLKLIVGIGPVNERKLHALDVKRFAQIAAWSAKDEESYGDKLEFPGRIEREEWVRQAKNLAEVGSSEDAGELAKRKGQSKSASLMGSTAKGKTTKPLAKAKVAAKPAAPAKKPMPMKLDKPIGGKPDNLTLINGIGNVIETKLNEMGVFHFEQVANWTMAQAESFSTAVGFRGRALREGWVKEAAIFAKGGTTEHAKNVEAGKITSSRVSTVSEKGSKK